MKTALNNTTPAEHSTFSLSFGTKGEFLCADPVVSSTHGTVWNDLRGGQSPLGQHCRLQYLFREGHAALRMTISFLSEHRKIPRPVLLFYTRTPSGFGFETWRAFFNALPGRLGGAHTFRIFPMYLPAFGMIWKFGTIFSDFSRGGSSPLESSLAPARRRRVCLV